MTELEKSAEKTSKLKRWGPVLAVLLIGAVILLVYIVSANQPLDKIQDYQVEVTPLEDGTLDITYRLRWEVLNSSREGPLSWVKIGMANENFRIKEYGGAILSPRNSVDSYASFSLRKEFEKGETAEFWFTVNQRRMLLRDSSDNGNDYYEFTPGWFPKIEVEDYLFSWKGAPSIADSNADRTEDGRLIWEGALKQNERVDICVTYKKGAFDPSTALYASGVTAYQENTDEGGGPDLRIILVIVFLTISAAILVSDVSGGSGYRGGRGYHMYIGGRRGGGGGCACACAGCACACACAGGGRAGCSNKDFYQPDKKEERPIEP